MKLVRPATIWLYYFVKWLLAYALPYVWSKLWTLVRRG